MTAATRPTIVILDADAYPRPYEVLPGPSGVLRLRHAETGRTYTLRPDAGRWLCNCPAATKGGRLGRPRPCKHSLYLEEIQGEIPMPVEPPPEAPRTLPAALAAAQAKCKAVPHDARNPHIGYGYASSEAIITEGKQALGAAGLALLPVEQTIGGAPERPELARKFLLLHASGEQVELTAAWPICQGPGRPLDKAVAAAATLSLAYLLRDLLLMPRVDPADEVAGRADRPAEPQKRPAPAAEPAGPRLSPGGKLLKMIGEKEALLVALGLCEVNALVNVVRSEGRQRGLADQIADWPAGLTGKDSWVREVIAAFEAKRRAAPVGR